MQLIQRQASKVYIHGIGTVSELTDHYYKNRKQYGYMEIVDRDGKILSRLGSKGVNHYANV